MSNAIRARAERRDGESFNSLLKRFRTRVIRNRVMTKHREHRFYMKPSEVRRLKRKTAIRRYQKQERKRLDALRKA